MDDSTIRPLLAGPVLTAGGFVLLLLALGLHTFDEPLLFIKVDIPILVVSFILSATGVILGPIVAFRQRRASESVAGLPKKRLWAFSIVSAFGLSLLTLPLGLYVLFWSMAYRML
ncbi:MAG: hypothetical protein P8R54_32510 [Myxococcota bacterium]|nr:hypothetical protein [Myxococcota bacterium]